jgi:YegS/Rv2252/BmrU family lipid kinase
VSRPERAAVVVNPTKVGNLAALRGRIDKLFADAGRPTPEYRETTPEDTGHRMAGELIAAGHSPLLVAGGDGTVRVVCAAASGTDTPLLIVPLGTGNLLARNLDLPLDTDEALAAAADGADRRVDLGGVEGDDLPATAFAVMAGMGFDAAMMADAPEGLKARVGALAYVVSGVRHLRDEAFGVRITVDGKVCRYQARTVLVGNVGSLQAGIELLPDASPDDGVLDVVVLAPRRLADWLRVAWHVLRHNPRPDHRLARLRGREIEVRADRPIERQLDGDPVGAGHELTITARPGAVLIRGPR